MQNVANKRKEYDSRIINNSLYISVTEEQRMVDILVLSSNIRKEKHKEEQHGQAAESSRNIGQPCGSGSIRGSASHSECDAAHSYLLITGHHQQQVQPRIG